MVMWIKPIPVMTDGQVLWANIHRRTTGNTCQTKLFLFKMATLIKIYYGPIVPCSVPSDWEKIWLGFSVMYCSHSLVCSVSAHTRVIVSLSLTKLFSLQDKIFGCQSSVCGIMSGLVLLFPTQSPLNVFKLILPASVWLYIMIENIL